MLLAYRVANGRLVRMEPDAPLEDALWIDLYVPQPQQVDQVNALGVEVPSLSDMEEIEISNRLYSEGDGYYMTAVLPGQTPEKGQASGPVTFILKPSRLITVRHHAPRPFETFPDRAERSATGIGSAAQLFLGLVEEIVARHDDLLEAVGRSLDEVARNIYGVSEAGQDLLQSSLKVVGREGEVLSRVRLGLLTVERMVGYFSHASESMTSGQKLKAHIRSHMRDIQALEVHADFLSARVGMVTDATLAMVNLAQNATVRILSVVTALFLPPTLIASAYGMNFRNMPELDKPWGYPMALVLMVGSALATYMFLRWKRWL